MPQLFRHPLTLLATLLALVTLAAAGPATSQAAPGHGPYLSQGMWIWYVSSSHGGNLQKIIKRAKQSRVKTLYIKSADGVNVWSQFNRPMVERLQKAGLKVCGWQYVYGTQPVKEANAAATAKRRGANCFVIDAEIEYEGRYRQADRYIRRLRKLVGPNFKLAFSSFPYNHFHPAMPYSVFLGPGGATANLPQAYWKHIGNTPALALRTTWEQNKPYRRRIFPIGLTYMDPPNRELLAFRKLVKSYGSVPSWWSWQETNQREWQALGKPVTVVPNFRPSPARPVVSRGKRGDIVVWMQQLLRGAGFQLPVNGVHGARSQTVLKKFQKRHNLKQDGVAGAATWRLLVKEKPARVNWAANAKAKRAGVSVAGPSRPLSADLPAIRNEIAGAKRPGP